VFARVAITGAHMLLYTSQAAEVRAALRDVFGWDYVEDHPGWLIFKLPPSEIGVHPVEGGDSPKHEVCLMCDDIESTIAELRSKGIEFRGDPVEASFGITTTMVLPGGLEILLYEPTHKSPLT
jgi:hypothetical protein